MPGLPLAPAQRARDRAPNKKKSKKINHAPSHAEVPMIEAKGE
jgi:hypothetical protein